LALLRVGFTFRPVSRAERGLLHLGFTITPEQRETVRVGCLVSAALSVGLLRPGVTGHPGSVELGLSSLYVFIKRDRVSLFLCFRSYLSLTKNFIY